MATEVTIKVDVDSSSALQKIKQLQTNLQGMGVSQAGGNAGGLQQMGQSFDQAGKKAEEASKKIKKAGDEAKRTGAESKKGGKGVDKLGNEAQDTAKGFDNVTKKTKTFKESVNALIKQVATLNQRVIQGDAVINKSSKTLQQHARRLKGEVAGGLQKVERLYASGKIDLQEYTQEVRKLNDLDEQSDKIVAKITQAINEKNKALRETAKAQEQMGLISANTANQMEEFKKGEISATQAGKALQKEITALEKIQAKLSATGRKGGKEWDANAKKMKALRQQYREVTSSTSKLDKELRELDNALRLAKKSGDAQAIQVLEQRMYNLRGTLAKVNKEAQEFAGTQMGVRAKKVAADFNKLSVSANQAQQKIAHMGKVQSHASVAMLDGSRIIEDSAFGIRGVANNIVPFIQSMTRLKDTAGGVKGAFKGIAASMIGPGGLFVLVSILTTLFITSGDKIGKFFFGDLLEKTKKLKEAIEEAQEAVKEIAKEIEGLQGMTTLDYARRDIEEYTKYLDEAIAKHEHFQRHGSGPDAFVHSVFNPIEFIQAILVLKQVEKAIEAIYEVSKQEESLIHLGFVESQVEIDAFIQSLYDMLNNQTELQKIETRIRDIRKERSAIDAKIASGETVTEEELDHRLKLIEAEKTLVEVMPHVIAHLEKEESGWQTLAEITAEYNKELAAYERETILFKSSEAEQATRKYEMMRKAVEALTASGHQASEVYATFLYDMNQALTNALKLSHQDMKDDAEDQKAWDITIGVNTTEVDYQIEYLSGLLSGVEADYFSATEARDELLGADMQVPQALLDHIKHLEEEGASLYAQLQALQKGAKGAGESVADLFHKFYEKMYTKSLKFEIFDVDDLKQTGGYINEILGFLEDIRILNPDLTAGEQAKLDIVKESLEFHKQVRAELEAQAALNKYLLREALSDAQEAQKSIEDAERRLATMLRDRRRDLDALDTQAMIDQRLGIPETDESKQERLDYRAEIERALLEELTAFAITAPPALQGAIQEAITQQLLNAVKAHNDKVEHALEIEGDMTRIEGLVEFWKEYEIAAKQAIDLVKMLTSNAHQRRINELNEEKQALNDKYTNELSNARLTQNMREQIQKRREKDLARLAEKEKELRQKQAMAAKAQAVFSIILDTAKAIIKAPAEVGPILGIPYVALIKALGVAQLAAVASAPMPSFEEGVTNFSGGLARVHQDELLVNLPQGSNVITNENVERLATLNAPGGASDQSVSNELLLDISDGLQGLRNDVLDQTDRLERVERVVHVRELEEEITRYNLREAR